MKLNFVKFYKMSLLFGSVILVYLGSNSQASSEKKSGKAVTTFAWIVTKRIVTGDILSENLVQLKAVDVESGILHDLKDILLGSSIILKNFEAIQTLVEGQYLTNIAVRKIPDIHRGDWVRIKLVAGSIVLQTTGISNEIGYLDQKIKVKSIQSKREFLGLLKPEGIVEVVL